MSVASGIQVEPVANGVVGRVVVLAIGACIAGRVVVHVGSRIPGVVDGPSLVILPLPLLALLIA